MVFGLRVISLKGDSVTFVTILFREWIGRFFSATIWPLYWVIGFTPKKQGLHAGDTSLFGDMKLIGERHPIDLAFLPIGDNFTMGIEDAAYAVELLNPQAVVPIHYDTFPPIKQNPQDFKELVKGATVHILSPGDGIEL